MARPPGITGQIKQAARQVLEQCPEGVRYMDLVGRVQALKFEPDIFYVNEFARRLRQTDPQTSSFNAKRLMIA